MVKARPAAAPATVLIHGHCHPKALGPPKAMHKLLARVPTSGQFDTHKHILAACVDEVRPLLAD